MATKRATSMDVRVRMHKENKAHIMAVEKKVGDLDNTVKDLSTVLGEHIKATAVLKENIDRVETNTKVIVDILENVKIGAKTVVIIGKLSRFLAYFTAGILALYSFWTISKDFIMQVIKHL